MFSNWPTVKSPSQHQANTVANQPKNGICQVLHLAHLLHNDLPELHLHVRRGVAHDLLWFLATAHGLISKVGTIWDRCNKQKINSQAKVDSLIERPQKETAKLRAPSEWSSAATRHLCAWFLEHWSTCPWSSSVATHICGWNTKATKRRGWVWFNTYK